LVIDADFGMRCMDMVLGVESETLFDCSDVLSGRCSPTAALTEVRGDSGFCFIPAPMNHTDGKLPSSAYNALFSELKNVNVGDLTLQLQDQVLQLLAKVAIECLESLH
jgi:septum formation inhibitor-activating ATPase MinD